ncbi:MAG: RDD family protein, partial [Pseudomonadales bacterium]|nr:RDD family protein [Pseudomonadales bacterium]
MTETSDVASIHYVGFWARFLAFIIDSVAVSILITPVVVMVLGEIQMADYDLQDAADLQRLLLVLTYQLSFDATLMAVIVILFWLFKSATPGKMLISATIVDAKTGAKPSTGQFLIRYLGYYVGLFPMGLGFLWVGFDPMKQGWHDKMAGTVVVKTSKRDRRQV